MSWNLATVHGGRSSSTAHTSAPRAVFDCTRVRVRGPEYCSWEHSSFGVFGRRAQHQLAWKGEAPYVCAQLAGRQAHSFSCRLWPQHELADRTSVHPRALPDAARPGFGARPYKHSSLLQTPHRALPCSRCSPTRRGNLLDVLLTCDVDSCICRPSCYCYDNPPDVLTEMDHLNRRR